jgi:sulfate permease, SulP family
VADAAMVLDTIGMTDLDYSGSHALLQMLDQLDSRGVSFAMVRTSKRFRAGLARSGLLARIGEDHLFASVGEAVNARHIDKPEGHSTAAGPTGSES